MQVELGQLEANPRPRDNRVDEAVQAAWLAANPSSSDIIARYGELAALVKKLRKWPSPR
jgi:hypothetical protein